METKRWSSNRKPIPKEHELEPAFINKSIEEALEKAEAGGIKGKKVTPFLLDYLKVQQGDSLAANIELVYNNARVGSQIAVELAKLD